MVGETDGRGLLECCMRFPGGAAHLPKRTRLCGDGFSRKASRALHRIARMLQALSGWGRAIAEKYAPVRRWIFAQG